MTFVSYSQNLEDVMLWRALKHVEKGFYVDVGANDPVELSVTNAFYQAGWHGINIDPVTYESLVHDRARDINLNVAISPDADEITFYKVAYSALSTGDMQTANNYRTAGYDVEKLQVPAMRLERILEQYSERDIHFMNIDVEGAEFDVLNSFDLKVWRPWVLLVESTLPNTQIPTHEKWESIVLSADYEFVYFDGLNRFYVANEHRELAEAFKLPPGVFDFYILAKHHDVEEKLSLAMSEIETGKRILEEKEKVIQLYQGSRFFWLTNGPIGWLRKMSPLVSLISKLRLFLFKSDN